MNNRFIKYDFLIMIYDVGTRRAAFYYFISCNSMTKSVFLSFDTAKVGRKKYPHEGFYLVGIQVGQWGNRCEELTLHQSIFFQK